MSGISHHDDATTENITLEELVDLALCTPDVGAVNFNILRILLREIIRNTDLSNVPAYINDVEAAQIYNYKNCMQGNGHQFPLSAAVSINSAGTNVGARGATYQRYASNMWRGPQSAREPLQQTQDPSEFNQEQTWDSQPPPGYQEVPPPPGFFQKPQAQLKKGKQNTTGPTSQANAVNTTGPTSQANAVNTTGPTTPPNSVNTTGPTSQANSVNTTGPTSQANSVNTTGPTSQANSVNTNPPTNNAGTQAKGPSKADAPPGFKPGKQVTSTESPQVSSRGSGPPDQQSHEGVQAVQEPLQKTKGVQTTPVVITDGVGVQSGQSDRGMQHGSTRDQTSGPTQKREQGERKQQQNKTTPPDVTQTQIPNQQQWPNRGQNSSGFTSQPSTKESSRRTSGARPQTEESEIDRPRSDSTSSTPRAGPHMSTKKLEEKVARLERHLEALYALPNNPDLLDMEDAHGMTVSDMWQVIQLNNRVAAAEAAIQKMATLIEDLARQMKGLRQNYETNIQQFFEMKDQFDPMREQLAELQALIDKMNADMETAKNELKRDIDKLTKATGVTLTRVPSFMENTGSEGTSGLAGDTGGPERGALGSDGSVHSDKSDVSKGRETGEMIVDEHGNPILGADGKPIRALSTKPLLGRDGKPLVGPNGKPLTNNMIQEFKLPDGNKLVGPDGNPVAALKSQILQEKDGQVKLGPEGRMLYTDVGQLALGPDGMPALSPEGAPVYFLPAKTMKGEGGKVLYGVDGKPIKITARGRDEPLTSIETGKTFSGSDGEPVMADQIVLGPNGQFLPGPDGNPILIQNLNGIIQLGSDGRPLVGEDGKLVYSKRGTIIMGPDGKPLVGPDKQPLQNLVGQLLVGPDGQPLVGSDGKPYLTPSGGPVYYKIGQILLEPNGTPLLGPNNEFIYSTIGEIKFDELGRPMFNPDGSPVWTNYGQSLIGPDGKPIMGAGPGLEYGGLGQGTVELDENGRPIYANRDNGMLGPDGNPILGPDGQPLTNQIGQLLLDPSSNTVKGPDGEDLYLTVGQINTDENVMPMVGPDGKLLFTNHGHVMIKPDGSVILGPDGRPAYGKQGSNVKGPDGKDVFGVDGNPIVLVSKPQKPGSLLRGPDGNLLVGPDGQTLFSNQALLGPDGKPMTDRFGNPILLFDTEGGHVTLGPDGKPLMNSDGTARYGTTGDFILGPDGQPLMGPQGPLMSHLGEIGLGPDGQPILNPDGSVLYTNLGNLVLNSDGQPILGPDGRPRYYNVAQIMVGDDGKPIYGPNGRPLYSANDTPFIGQDGKLTSKMYQSIEDGSNVGGLGGMTPEECRRHPELCQGVQTDKLHGPLYDEGTCPVPVGMIDEAICQDVDKANLVGYSDFDLHKTALNQDMVRRYCELQGMQRQIVNDIQDKMEAMYTKLLREIANQQMTSSPYMAVGPGLGRCMGPGICSGHGMPAGTAVCQFPALNEGSKIASAVKGHTEPCPYCHGAGRNPCGICRYCQGTGIFKERSIGAAPCVASDTSIFPGSSRQNDGSYTGRSSERNGPYQYSSGGARPCNHGLEEYKICGGPALCPGTALCPTCKDDDLRSLRSPRRRGQDPRGRMMSDTGLCDEKDPDSVFMDILRKECKTMILLPKDLEELRQRVKREGKLPTVFDEMDVLERLHTLWEAVIALKHNDEALAVRIIKLDASMKCIPKANVVERLHKIPLENFDAIAAASPDKPMIIPSSTSLTRMMEEADCDLLPKDAAAGEKEQAKRSKKGYPGGDLQPVMNNITNLLAESSQQKDKLDDIYEAIKHFENSMVTKDMLMDALEEKADKDHIGGKVGYEEFGNSIEDLTTRVQNLLIEVYEKNENWKNVTDHLGEELSSKLDKVELAPIRAYFKSHLKALEDRVTLLMRQLEEPDPAGTRKKLLKDYNCISCDRHVNISGVTNSTHLPHCGPMLSGHNTAPQRAFDLHRMRQQKLCRYGPEGRDMNLLCKDLEASGDRSGGFSSNNFGMNGADMAHLVNRYVGGSHTSVPAAERISAMHRRSKGEYTTVEHTTSPALSARFSKRSSLVDSSPRPMPPRFDYTPNVFDE